MGRSTENEIVPIPTTAALQLPTHSDQVAYFCTHSRAVWSCLARSFKYTCAISGTNGSFGFGSVSNDDTDNKTFEMVSAGLHWSFKISRQIAPLALTLQPM